MLWPDVGVHAFGGACIDSLARLLCDLIFISSQYCFVVKWKKGQLKCCYAVLKECWQFLRVSILGIFPLSQIIPKPKRLYFMSPEGLMKH